MQHTTEIPRDAWDQFFNQFSQDHDTHIVAVEVMGREIGAQIEGRSLLLSGISPADDKRDSIALSFDSLDGDEHLTHMVNKPTHVWIQRSEHDADEALEIEDADGTRTLVRFPRV